jgi:hypothetical protein
MRRLIRNLGRKRDRKITLPPEELERAAREQRKRDEEKEERVKGGQNTGAVS